MIKSPHNKPMGTVIDRNSVQMDYKSYNDEGVEDLSRAMEERDWGSEGTAWVRACEIRTSEIFSYFREQTLRGSAPDFFVPVSLPFIQ